ncbi:hypothetical protein MTO98_32710 [Mucilaginibacter sp. SMC90]|uniref:ORC-CDC6 family AAA ATPase n=1 Tax=Mucilaginibacter sp. SMC90 TaxID=2929803 RepID=UPI001FB4D3B1|nr:hypothetical protein [Mucilaginibacter sp. SMC90]UOE49158.1 hypothetical protein MTO98_32710 [Mucilaginibacter sp. SMC90]
MRNPFEVNTPEGISAKEVYELFVDVFTDFYQVPEIGHTFLNGPRGSGKSMMFRYMMPDCQKIDKNCSLSELEYFSLYAPIKLTDINYPELDRLKDSSNTFFNEHLLTTYVASKCFNNILQYREDIDCCLEEIERFYNETFLWYVDISGQNIDSYKVKLTSSAEYIEKIVKILDEIFLKCKTYCKKVGLSPAVPLEYNGPLCNYLDFLYPLLMELKKLAFFPADKPIFILVDDAGYLNETQTRILNTWVSYRTSKDISIKISTQLDYKSLKTVTNKTIDSPHDYSQVNIATVYTTSNNNYYKRIERIVSKRIEKYLEKKIDPVDFFPFDADQDKEIEAIKANLKLDYSNPDKAYAGGDAARRYATSEFVKKLKGSRAGSHFNYAGFDNLVDISSGIIRHFLEPATRMFSNHISRNEVKVADINFIPVIIQDTIIKEYSSSFLENEFQKVIEEHGHKGENERLSKADKLYNLIIGLGQMFHRIFVSDRAERIVFSVALNDNPDNELKEIIELAEHYGYLHKSSIGNKQGTGRCRLYILSRTLSPYFKLDPAGFKGYKFMNSSLLKISLTDPARFEREANKTLSNGGEDPQLSLLTELD